MVKDILLMDELRTNWFLESQRETWHLQQLFSLILNLVSFIEKINTTQHFNLVTKMEKKTSTT